MRISLERPEMKWGKTESGLLVGAIVTIVSLTFGLSPEWQGPLIVVLSAATAFITVR